MDVSLNRVNKISTLSNKWQTRYELRIHNMFLNDKEIEVLNQGIVSE